ncbi:MAG: glycosyl transferase family 39 [uncultured bacterium]|nr:MAG: glycosyl transferase family 39 [uncultured bacterium]HBR71214.1 hypothetical protein [Candidatus Moranbacteria bacterium]
MNTQNKNLTVWIILFAIILAAFFLRFYNIENLPSGIYPDEAVNGIDAYGAQLTGNYQLFYPDNNGREGLFINLQALSIKFLGNTVTALKLWSIIFGTLTVLGVFLLSQEIFRSYRAGLISAYLTAFSYWAINFSRIGFRAIMVPLITTFSFYFLLRGFRTKKYINFILSGLIFGLGFHTYIAFRITPVIVVALLIFLSAFHKHFVKIFWKQILIFGIAAFITLSPMIYEFYTHPEYLESRSASVSIFSPEMNKGNIVTTFFRSLGLSLVKYNFWGDQNWRHNYPPYPILNPIVGITFLTGLLYTIYKTFHLLWLRYKHNIRDEKFFLYLFILTWFVCMLVPEFLTAEGLPHSLRSIGTLPTVMILATIPFLWIIGKIQTYSYSLKITAISLLAASFIFIGIFDPIKYFLFFQNNPKQHSSFNANLKDIAYYIQTLPKNTIKYIVAGNMERIPIKYLNPTLPNAFYVHPDQLSSIKPTGNFVIVTTPDQAYNVSHYIEKMFPAIKKIEHENLPGDKFFEFKK